MTAPQREQVLDYLHGQSDAMIRMLESLTRAESPSSSAAAQFPVKKILADEFVRLGFRVRALSGRSSGGSLFARPEPRTRQVPLQLLLGATATAPAADRYFPEPENQ